MTSTNTNAFDIAKSLPKRQFFSMQHCTDVVDELDYVLARAMSGEPTGLVISGPTGVGKSSILKYHKVTYDTRLAEDENSPIVLVKTPSKPSDSLMLEHELKALGDPNPYYGKPNMKRSRRDALLALRKVKVLVYDDFQHIVEHRGTHVARQLLDELKNLSEEFCISLVFTGIDSVELVGLINEQIDSRFSTVVNVKVMSVENDEEFGYFKLFINKLITSKGLKDKKLFEDDFIYRFYYACEADLRILNNLFNKAMFWQQKEGNKQITLAHFARAFDAIKKEVWDGKKYEDKPNPFDSSQWKTMKKDKGIT